MACQTGLSECQNLTIRWFRQWMDEPQHNGSVCWVTLKYQPAGTGLITDIAPQDPSEPPFGGVLRCHRGGRCSRVGLRLVVATERYGG